MATVQQLESELSRLRGVLLERDRREAVERAAALAKQQMAEAAADLAAQAEARAAEVDLIRRGAWAAHIIKQQPDATSPLDLAAVDAQIPANGWPPGEDESKYNIRPAVAKRAGDVESTLLGKLRTGGHNVKR